MSKSELQQACEAHGITITSVHMNLEWEPDSKYPMDKWSCTVHFNGKSATFDFKTGIGHRVVAPGWKKEGQDKWASGGGVVALGLKEGISMGAIVVERKMNAATKRREVVGPSVADVLRAYLDESRACETTFDDWCSEWDVSNDSIKQWNLYLQCQREGTKLYKLLGREVVEELRGKEH